ncbi:MAG TPA: glycosyltransferase family 2 protein [Elusimicrobia bacterium]|nr:glycosyltransferase family 2 protein [Elusimicrobiota bacterium]
MGTTQNKPEKYSLSVIIPAFQEEAGIAGVLSGLRAALEARRGDLVEEFELLVVDDGSSDGTAAAAERCGARVVRHPTNMGYGRTLLTGFQNARFDWLLMIDADGSYPPDQVLKVLEEGAGFDMVIGARQGAFFWGSPFRALLRRIYLFIAGFVAGVRIPDANSGLRLVHKPVLTVTMPVLCYGYSFSTTMTLSFLQGGRFVRFVPIAFRERQGKSKVSMLRDILRTLQIMVQVVLYYNPLKFAAVLAMIPGALCAAFSLRHLAFGSFGDLALAVQCGLSALFVFLFGCLLDSLRIRNKGL